MPKNSHQEPSSERMKNAAQDRSGEAIKDAAAEAVRQGTDIRAKMHELTLLALQRQRFDRHGMREVIRAVTEGAALGAEKSRADMRLAMSEALSGLDQALRTSAEAGQAALKQLASTGKGFSDSEFKQALANLRKLEDDFLSTVEQVADAANERVQPGLREALRTARRTGTQTGKQVAGAMGDFAQKFSAASMDAAVASLEAAGEFGARFAAVASGILGGLAEALRAPPASPEKKDKPKES
jgi:hypothetical protein